MTVHLCIDAGPTENTHRRRGIGTVTRELLRAIDEQMTEGRGLRASYLRRARLPDAALGAGVRAWFPRSRSADWTGVADGVSPLRANWWQAVDAVTAMPRDVARTGAQVLLATDPHAVPLGRGFATVAILYDVAPLVFPDAYLGGRAALPRRLLYQHRIGRLRRASHIVAISRAAADDAVALAGFDAARISIAPLAVDRSAYRALDPAEARGTVAARLGLAQPYVLHVGECDARKNVRRLIDAFLAVAARHPDVELVMAGASAVTAAPLQEAIAGHPEAARVRFPGHVPSDALPALYAGARLFAFPSLYEGFGLPVLEAMSCGTPVLTSRRSSIPEVAGDAAAYADVESGASIAESLDALLADEARRVRLRDAGLAQAARFSWRRTAELVLDACATAARERAR